MLATSCGTKKIAALESKNKEIQDLLNTATVKLNTCLTEKEGIASQLDFLKKNNSDLINNMGNLTTLSSKGAENIEKALESIKEKDLKITRMQDALTKKDSVTLALVTSLKREVGIDDPDININVEKRVVMISIADNLLFKSGSYEYLKSITNPTITSAAPSTNLIQSVFLCSHSFILTTCFPPTIKVKITKSGKINTTL